MHPSFFWRLRATWKIQDRNPQVSRVLLTYENQAQVWPPKWKLLCSTFLFVFQCFTKQAFENSSNLSNPHRNVAASFCSFNHSSTNHVQFHYSQFTVTFLQAITFLWNVSQRWPKCIKIWEAVHHLFLQDSGSFEPRIKTENCYKIMLQIKSPRHPLKVSFSLLAWLWELTLSIDLISGCVLTLDCRWVPQPGNCYLHETSKFMCNWLVDRSKLSFYQVY